MIAFVFRLVTTSPSSEYKTIKSRIFKESSHLIFQKLMKMPSRWQIFCPLCIEFKKRTRVSEQRCSPRVLYVRVVIFHQCKITCTTTSFMLLKAR